ncbi:MAG: GrpB family protein [Verrucomicrobiota bacterium]|nr:GrpB family protein [Verrucomicrobiota bacterium]
MNIVGYKIELVPYSEEWVTKFEREKELLGRTLAPHRHQIEHIGSTAVRDALAKAIIDIAALIDSVQLVPQIVQPLAGLSYQHMGEFGLPGRHFFIKGDPRAYHLHIVDATTDHWQRWIKFRDALRNDAELRKQYERSKADLAGIYHSNHEKYTAAKSSFINAMIEGRRPA